MAFSGTMASNISVATFPRILPFWDKVKVFGSSRGRFAAEKFIGLPSRPNFTCYLKWITKPGVKVPLVRVVRRMCSRSGAFIANAHTSVTVRELGGR
jgi:hypothetical protein